MWGWGLTTNQSGDGYGFIINLVQAFGGHYTDPSGMKVVFNSPETVAASDGASAARLNCASPALRRARVGFSPVDVARVSATFMGPIQARPLGC